MSVPDRRNGFPIECRWILDLARGNAHIAAKRDLAPFLPVLRMRRIAIELVAPAGAAIATPPIRQPTPIPDSNDLVPPLPAVEA